MICLYMAELVSNDYKSDVDGDNFKDDNLIIFKPITLNGEETCAQLREENTQAATAFKPF